MVAPEKERTQVLVAHQSKAPFSRTTVKKTDSQFLAVGRQKWIKTPGGKLSGPLV